MSALSNYTILELLYEDSSIKICRGYENETRIPVIVKMLKEEAAGLIEASKIIHEFEITRGLAIDGIAKYIKLERTESTIALIMEDIKGISLKKHIEDHPVDLYDFLGIGIHLTNILGLLHQNCIIHRGLKPENIFVDPGTGKVHITDFSNSAFFSITGSNAQYVNSPTGSLEYMAPEMTGRLKIRTDSRSDIYSLGVIFYEVITGHLPLYAENPSDWIYAHLAQKPQPPNKVNPDIPSVISDIIMKMLAKAPEKRYQSAYGLLQDLKACRERLIETGKVDSFPIGLKDVAYFQLPCKLYGREEEKKRLRDIFNDVCNGSAKAILISGYTGVGKTTLINEGLRSLVLRKGYYIAGEFDQLKKNIPYAPFADAFGSLIMQLMTKNQSELNSWKERILHTLGRNGAVITEIIPELEYIIGKQPPVDDLPLKESENRFLMTFRNFISLFAWKGHPLVLFIDDLQWADPACIKLLKYLIDDAQLHYILIIGGFRSNEVDKDHPIAKMLEGTYDGQLDVQHISIMSLDWEQTTELVADVLHMEPKKVSTLSEVLYRKSGGNPLFLGQLLMLIHDEGLLYFDMQEGCWKWKLEAIQELEPGDNVLEIFLKKLERLPEETLEVMKMAACIGNKFDLETLSAACSKSLEETASCLMPAILQGLISHSPHLETEPSTFRFLHDRVQQAFYSLITENEKKEKHLTIGLLLLKNANPEI